jgi:hypothetical protein
MHLAIRGFGWRRADRFFIVSSLGNRRSGSPILGEFYFLLRISGSRELGIVISAVSQHRPGHARRLVSQGNRRYIGVRSISQVGDPATQCIVASLRLRDDGSSTVDEDAP